MKLCAACHQDLPKDRFSKKQWKLGADSLRRCKVCVSDNREVQPLTPNNMDAPANNNNGIVSSLESMSMNDNKMISPSDEDLFKLPPRREDCPICFLRMPSMWTGHNYRICCGKFICCGCIYADAIINGSLCPFCRTPAPKTDEEAIEFELKLIEKDDAHAIHNQGSRYADGEHGYPQDFSKALELWHRAGELGHAESYHNIACLYKLERDMTKARHYWEKAALSGDAMARYNLGIMEEKAGNTYRALKHHMIATKDGYLESLERIKTLYSNGDATKDDYAKALRARQAYLDEIRSDQRDEAAAVSDEYKYY